MVGLLLSEAAAVARHDEMMFRKFAFFFFFLLPLLCLEEADWPAAFGCSIQ